MLKGSPPWMRSKRSPFYGDIDDTDENGFVASRSSITTLKGPSAGTVTSFSKMRRSSSRYARVVEGRQKKWWQFWK